MANLADRIFIAQENATTVTHLMTTRGQSEYAGHEADLAQLWDEIDDAQADYLVAKTACLGGTR